MSEKHTINTKTALSYPYHGDWEIGESFEIVRHKYLVVTEAQAHSFERLIQAQGRENFKGVWIRKPSDPYLVVQFTDLVIGIEPDGYAHS